MKTCYKKVDSGQIPKLNTYGSEFNFQQMTAAAWLGSAICISAFYFTICIRLCSNRSKKNKKSNKPNHYVMSNNTARWVVGSNDTIIIINFMAVGDIEMENLIENNLSFEKKEVLFLFKAELSQSSKNT